MHAVHLNSQRSYEGYHFLDSEFKGPSNMTKLNLKFSAESSCFNGLIPCEFPEYWRHKLRVKAPNCDLSEGASVLLIDPRALAFLECISNLCEATAQIFNSATIPLRISGPAAIPRAFPLLASASSGPP